MSNQVLQKGLLEGVSEGRKAFGMGIKNREYVAFKNFRYSFNGQEKDDETKGSGNSYNFGARGYDPRLGRWMSVDPKAYKYTTYSPYHAMYDNPIAVIDRDGRENIVVVGNQGMSPNSDKVFDINKEFDEESYVYGEGKRHFLQAGLDEAIRLNKQEGEKTTMIIYRGSYTQKEIDTYIKLATAADIQVKVMDNVNQIADYVNKKNGDLDRRGDDLITDFTYVGHSGAAGLWVGNYTGNGKRDISVGDIQGGLFDKKAFHSSSAFVLNSCQPFGSNGKKPNIGTAFSSLAGSGGVTGSKNYTNWGQGGLGKFTWNNGTVKVPGTGGTEGPVGDNCPDNSGGDDCPDDGGNDGSDGGSTQPSRPRFDCFIRGTKITMSDGTLRSIENIKVGDKVQSFNLKTLQTEVDEVLEIASPLHDNLVMLTFSDGTINGNTPDHPYYVKAKGWCSLNPDQTQIKYGIKVGKLEVGDICFKLIAGKITSVTLSSFIESKVEKQTYNISVLKVHNCYFANGILVNNEKNNAQ